MKNIVTHDPSKYSYLVHFPGQEPVHTVKYNDAEDRDEAKRKAEAHANKLNKINNEGRIMKSYSTFVAEQSEILEAWGEPASAILKDLKNQRKIQDAKAGIKGDAVTVHKAGKNYSGAADAADDDGEEIQGTEKPVADQRVRADGTKMRGRKPGFKLNGAGKRHNSTDKRTDGVKDYGSFTHDHTVAISR